MSYKLRSKYLPENFSDYEYHYQEDELTVYVPMIHTDSAGEQSDITKTFTINIDDGERWAITQAKVNDAILEEIS